MPPLHSATLRHASENRPPRQALGLLAFGRDPRPGLVIIRSVSQASHPLLDSVTSALAGNDEQQLAARDLLGQTFDPLHPNLEPCARRLQAPASCKSRILLHTLLWLAAVAAILAAASRYATTFTNFALLRSSFELPESFPSRSPLPQLTREQRLLLGDPQSFSYDTSNSAELHRLRPENPAYFAEYAINHLNEHDSLPPGFLDTAAQIDPENALFPYFAAAALAKTAIEKQRQPGPTPPSRTVAGKRLPPPARESLFTIKDPAAFDEAFSLLTTAAQLPRLASHTTEMICARAGILPVNSLADFSLSLYYSYSTLSPSIRFRSIADLICARAGQLADKDQTREFLELAALRERLLQQLTENPDTHLIGELVFFVIASSTATNLHHAAERLGLDELANAYRAQREALQQENDNRQLRSGLHREDNLSMLIRLTLPMIEKQVATPPPLTDASFKPLRMAEHELLRGLGLLAIALLLPLAAAFVSSLRFTVSPILRHPARTLAGSLGPLDHLLIFALGVLPPLAAFLLITRISPLDGSAYGASYYLFLFPGLHLAALLLALLLAPPAIARWRLAKHLGPFNLPFRRALAVPPALLGILLASCLTALPLLQKMGMKSPALAVLAIPALLCLSYLLISALLLFLGSPATRLAQATTRFSFLPAYALASIALCALIPLHLSAEQSWVRQDTLLRIQPNPAKPGAYEFQIAAQKRAETKAILQNHPIPNPLDIP
jgi:hypothetical protein